MENTSPQQLISSLIAFRNIHTEIQGIETEIKNVKMRLKPRLDELKTSYMELERIIVEHLEKNNEPGVQYQNMLFLLDEKKPQETRQKKEEAIISFLKKHNVQNPTIALEEVRKIFPTRSSKTESTMKKKTVKIKKMDT